MLHDRRDSITWRQIVADACVEIVTQTGNHQIATEQLFVHLGGARLQFPNNQHPREKMRQSLQKLVKDGLLVRVARGVYRLNRHFDGLDYTPLPCVPSAVPTVERPRLIRLRNTMLAMEVKRRYRNICQLCRCPLWIAPGTAYAEAHHLRPLGDPHHGPDVAGNIIVLCPNHHVLFDRGAVVVSVESMAVSHCVNGALGDNLRLHIASWHNIDPDMIRYHNQRVSYQQSQP